MDDEHRDEPRDNPAMDGMLREVARAAEDTDGSYVARVMAAVRNEMRLTVTLADARRFWERLGGKTLRRVAMLTATAAMLATLTFSLKVFKAQAEPAEVFIYARQSFSPDRNLSCHVLVRDGKTGSPIKGRSVNVRLEDGTGKALKSIPVTTDGSGMAMVESPFPAIAEGEYRLVASLADGREEVAAATPIAVHRSYKCMLTTDKPTYQPGQAIRMRALVLDAADLRPAAERGVSLEVFDPKGNKVFRHVTKASAFGLVWGDFVLADRVNEGDYLVKAVIGDTVTEKLVEVKRYVLPKFGLTVATERGWYGPGDTVRGTVTATYHFGRPVAGAEVTVALSDFIGSFTEFATAVGRTDDTGRFTFAIPLKDHFAGSQLLQGDAMVKLDLAVKDAAGHQEVSSRKLVIANDRFRLELFPENGKSLVGVATLYYMYLGRPDGTPVKAELDFGPAGTVTTGDNGLALITLTPERNVRIAPPPRQENSFFPMFRRGSQSPPNDAWELACRVKVDNDEAETVKTVLPVVEGQPHFILRTDKSIYTVGDTAAIHVESSLHTGPFFVDLVRDGMCVMMQRIEMVDGHGECAVDLGPDLAGTIQIHVYTVAADGDIASDLRLIQVNPSQSLQVAAELDRKTYRPGESCQANFAVSDESGHPVVAALSLAAVDEAVFSLQQMHPGFERMYFLLQEELLTPRYQVKAAETLLPGEDLDREDRQREAGLLLTHKVDTNRVHGASGRSYAERLHVLQKRKRDLREKLLQGAVCVCLAIAFLLALPLLLLAGKRTVQGGARQAEFIRCSRLEWNHAVGVIVRKWAAIGLLVIMMLCAIAWSKDANVNAWQEWPMPILIFFIGLLAWPIHSLVSMRSAYARLFAHSRRLDILHRVMYPTLFAYPVLMLAILLMVLLAMAYPGNRSIFGLATGLAILAFLTPYAILACGRTAYTGVSLVSRPKGEFGRGLGMGMKSGTPWHLLLGLALFSPLYIIIAIYFLGALAMFMPFVKITETLGDGGGGWGGGHYSSSREDAKSFRQLVPGRDEPLQKQPAALRVRRLFPETLLWRPEIITDEQGRATLEFPLADAITTWRMSTGAVAADGRMGDATTGIVVFQEFFVDLDVPVSLTQHDVVSIPVAVYNYLDEPQTVTLELEGTDAFRISGPSTQTLTLAAGEVGAAAFTVEALRPGQHVLTIQARGKSVADAVARPVAVVPDGKRVSIVLNGSIMDGCVDHEFDLPAEAVAGSAKAWLKIHPAAFSQIVEGMDAILRMPYGCFEQTSSITYPNILILDYMRQTRRISPEIELKAQSLINTGYQRLLTFETRGGGFEWFGREPADLVLSAYGLMEFCDMARVHDGVDPEVIARTRQWLLKQRSYYGSWQQVDLAKNAYVIMALAQSGESPAELAPSYDWLAAQMDQMNSPYLLALCANAFLDGNRPEARDVIQRLVKLRQEDEKTVWWSSGGEGVMYSWGQTHDVETTALAAIAMLKAEGGGTLAVKALRWIVGRKSQYGTWDSTQATILALKALAAGTQHAEFTRPYTVAIRANGVESSVDITRDNYDVLHCVSLHDALREGRNAVTMATSPDASFSYQLLVEYYLPVEETIAGEEPLPPQDGPLKITATYDKARLRVDDILDCAVAIENRSTSAMPMVLVDVGLPPGFTLLPDTLNELMAARIIERWENPGRQVIIYLRELAAGAKLDIPLEMRAKFPVKVKTPPARAYPYYQPELQAETRPVAVEVEK